MSEKKIKVDKMFLVMFALSFVTCFISLDVAKVVVPGILIGFLGPSILFSKDIKKIEADPYTVKRNNLIEKLLFYTVLFAIAMRIGENTFYVAIITLMVYRYTVIRALKK